MCIIQHLKMRGEYHLQIWKIIRMWNLGGSISDFPGAEKASLAQPV